MMREGMENFRTLRGYARLGGVLRGTFDQWAGIELAGGAAERAATLLGGADELVGGAMRLPHEQAAFENLRRELQRVMSPEAYERAWKKGKTFNFDQLLEFAIDD